MSVRSLPCCLAWPRGNGLECLGPVECCHVTSRGAGGKDRGNTVPMCHGHHMMQHAMGITSFQATFRVDLRMEAERVELGYQLDGRDW